jgi:hypothetical protein
MATVRHKAGEGLTLVPDPHTGHLAHVVAMLFLPASPVTLASP